MDVWVTAAAAGAGLAKYFQNRLRNRNSLSELSHGVSDYERPESPLPTEQLHSKSCPFRRLARRKKLGADVSTEGVRILDKNFTQMSQSDGASVSEVGCTVGDHLETLDSGDDCNLHPMSVLKPGLLTSANLQENEDRSSISDDIGNNSGDMVPEFSIWEMGYSYGCSTSRKRSSLIYKQSCAQFVKPASSLESCLMAQLYKEQAEMEEYVLTFLQSPSVRPMFVTDGSQIISRGCGDSFRANVNMEEKELYKKPYLKEKETVIGLPPLPKIGSSEPSGKIKHNRGRGWNGRLRKLNKVVDGKHFHLQGSIDGSYLFSLGLSVGIISAVISNKREVNKLKESLVHTENLVQDLQDELEMKDSLTVKELADEYFEPQNTSDHSFSNKTPNASLPQVALDKLRKYDDIEHIDIERCHCKDEEKSESISNIEAELEAELERLELSMNPSRLKTKLSDIVELDPEFEATFVQGELGAGKVAGRAGVRPDSDRDTSETSTTHSTKYAVSPRELTMRLHEVIESRLEERVKELETALDNSQRKVRSMESERMKSWKEFADSKPAFPCTGVTPTALEESNDITRPLLMNLSEEALDSYNEACTELLKANESEQECLASGVDRNDEYCISMSHRLINKQKSTSSPRTIVREHISRVQELNVVSISGDENSDCDDEMEMLLIKQIVEKTKKSPVILNAQRLLFQLDEDEL